MEEKINYLEKYHEFLNKVSKDFDKYLLKEIDEREDSKTLKKLYSKFLKLKLGVSHQRVGWVFIAAKVFGIDILKNYEKLLKLSAVPEVLIWSEYAFNWVTDGKQNDSGTKLEENIQLITSQYLLTEATHFLPSRMLKKYLELYRWGIFGCLTVEEDLRITNWEKIKHWDVFWQKYSEEHAIPDVGALYGYCFELVKDYFEINIDEKTMEKIIKIGFDFGRDLQINGDISDFIIPNEKIHTTEKRPKKDYFIDIRTDRLTYPTWLLLKYSEKGNPELHKEVIESAKNRKYKEGFFEKVYNYLQEKEIIKEVLEFNKNEKKRLFKEIDSLGLNDEGANFWKASILLLIKNKFVKVLRLDYDLVQKNKNEKRKPRYRKSKQ